MSMMISKKTSVRNAMIIVTLVAWTLIISQGPPGSSFLYRSCRKD